MISSLCVLARRSTAVICLALVSALSFLSSAAGQQEPAGSKGGFAWREVEPGYAIGRYALGNQLLPAEVILLKFNPRVYSFRAVLAREAGSPGTDVRSLTKHAGGMAGINANFFDANGSPLGLLIADGQERNKMHRGGRLLTGVFYLEANKAAIVHRDELAGSTSAEIAVQAGPRLIAKGKPLKISETDNSTRRSGIAITNSGDVVLFATLLRFPGASLTQIQQMLLDPALDIASALNFDGGGSSQLFVEKNALLADETFMTGGDTVPAALIVTRKTEQR